jgi:hypothetical protein
LKKTPGSQSGLFFNFRLLILAFATVVLPLSTANAADYLFNNSTNNEVGGGPNTIFAAPGSAVQISLQVNLGAGESTSAVDYWLIQASGPTPGAFSIVGRDYTGSSFSDPSATNAQVTSTSDNYNNSTGAPGADGNPDNALAPRNVFDLGSSTSDQSTKTNGVFQIATFTLQFAANAATGMYEIRTFDLAGFGINDVTPAHQATIFIGVPEPATWSLLSLGGLGALGVNRLYCRCRRLSAGTRCRIRNAFANARDMRNAYLPKIAPLSMGRCGQFPLSLD